MTAPKYLHLDGLAESPIAGKHPLKLIPNGDGSYSIATRSGDASGAGSGLVIGTRQQVEPLGTPMAAQRIALAAASARVTLAATTTRISIHARGTDARYVVGIGAVSATATSHFIAQGERLDLLVIAGSSIAALAEGTGGGALEITELA